METYTIAVRELPPICKIGEKIYVIHEGIAERFRTKCPVCDDEKKIKYRGYEMGCPYCTSAAHSGTIDQSSIRIPRYEIVEYIVNGVYLEGPDTKIAYEPKNRNNTLNLPRIKKVEAFHRASSSWNSVTEIVVPTGGYLDPKPELVLMVKSTNAIAFTSRQKAQEAVNLLTERARKALVAFNEKYGCSFEFPEEAAK